MDALKKWMISWFKQYQITTLDQNECSSKNLVQIILAAKWLVWDSRTSPKQQRRPLPSLLSLMFFYGLKVHNRKAKQHEARGAKHVL